MFWHATKEVARKEFLQHIRSTRLIIVAALFAISLIVTTIVLPLTLGIDEFFPDRDDFSDGDSPFPGYFPSRENFAMTLFLTIPILGGTMFILLLSVVMTSDGVCSEWQNRSIFLLLSKPVPRSAFVLGKFLGSVLPLISIVTVLMTINYFVLQLLYSTSMSGEDVGRFFGGLGFIILTMVVFATMGLFFSTLTRSTLASLFMTFAAGFLVLPLIGLIGEIRYWGDLNKGVAAGQDAVIYDWSRYFNPGSMMSKATEIIGGPDFGGFGLTFLVPTAAPELTWLSAMSGVFYAAAFFLGALIVVNVRNFE